MMELCTESSHINPLLGPGLLLSLPPMSFCLFCLCLCHSVCCSCCLSSSLSLLFSLLFSVCLFLYSLSLQSCLSNRSTLQISHCLTLLSLQVIDTSVTGCHLSWECPTDISRCQMSLWPEDEWEEQKRDGGETAGVVLCVFVWPESQERLKDRESARDWVSGYSDGTESLFQDSGDRYPRCLRSQPSWAQ